MGRKGKDVFVHGLANTQINSNKPVTLKVLNEILAYSNILVSEETLISLINMPRLTFYDLHKQKTVDSIYEKLGKPGHRIQLQGVYIFTEISTCRRQQKYVGSSSKLAYRLRGYLNETHKSSGKLIPLMEKIGLSKFKLEVICLPYYPEARPEIVLEQYFLLDPCFSLNKLRLSNNPEGSNSKALFMYNRDKSILYYFTIQSALKDFISKLNISHFTFTKHLAKGTYYLGKYLFTSEKVNTAKLELMTLPEIALMLNRDRVKLGSLFSPAGKALPIGLGGKLPNREKPVNNLSKAIVLIDVLNNDKLLFESLEQCVKFLKSKGFSAAQEILVKRMNTDQSYKGYIVKTADNK